MDETTARSECRVTWCTRTVQRYVRAGLCNACQVWANRHGGADPESPDRKPRSAAPADGLCVVVVDGEKCLRPFFAKGMCSLHYRRHRNTGSTAATSRSWSTTKPRRASGEMLALVRAAARTTSDDCFLAPCEGGRPNTCYRGSSMKAARAVWWEATGEHPGEHMVLHTCHRGDEGCISFRHLYLGDHVINMADKVEAGRQPKGEEIFSSVLTETQIREIRTLSSSGEVSQSVIAERYGINQATVSKIVNRRLWKHVK